MKKVVIIGGGAAGFFSAINCAEKSPHYQITILEKSATVLNKVKISGGGRCNVTHACFDAKELVKNYPRGEKQLLGSFTRFNPSSTIDWFAERGVKLKREQDGRMFPVTDSSQTVIDCFLAEAKRHKVQLQTRCGAQEIRQNGNHFDIKTTAQETISADAVVLTSGSNHEMWEIVERLGHSIIPPVASLFSFNINDKRIKGLEGLSVSEAQIKIKHQSSNHISKAAPLLITHWGISGPAVLRFSAFAARELSQLNYQFEIEVNWINKTPQWTTEQLKQTKNNKARKTVYSHPQFFLPRRIWENMVTQSTIGTGQNYADLSNAQINLLAQELTNSCFIVSGKSTNKDEFVTCGGVDLAEIDFRTMMSRKVPNLFFAGEILDIDGVTGGFNFQSAWTTAYIASQAI